jgi:hypothetical protein
MGLQLFTKRKERRHILSDGVLPKKQHKVQVFRKRKQEKPSFPSKQVALEIAQDITNSDHVAVKRRRIPSDMINYIEKNTKVKFKKKPKFYTYSPKKGHRFRPKKQVGGWDGASATVYDIDSGSIGGTVVVLPESHLKNKNVKDNVLLHELVETNIGQQLIDEGSRRSQQEVNNFEHAKFAMVYEKRDLDKKNMTRQDVSRLAKELFNEHMTKKRE